MAACCASGVAGTCNELEKPVDTSTDTLSSRVVSCVVLLNAIATCPQLHIASTHRLIHDRHQIHHLYYASIIHGCSGGSISRAKHVKLSIHIRPRLKNAKGSFWCMCSQSGDCCSDAGDSTERKRATAINDKTTHPFPANNRFHCCFATRGMQYGIECMLRPGLPDPCWLRFYRALPPRTQSET